MQKMELKRENGCISPVSTLMKQRHRMRLIGPDQATMARWGTQPPRLLVNLLVNYEMNLSAGPPETTVYTYKGRFKFWNFIQFIKNKNNLFEFGTAYTSYFI